MDVFMRRSIPLALVVGGLLLGSGCSNSTAASGDQSPPTNGAVVGTEFSDPQGAYTIVVDPTWQSVPFEDKAMWLVGKDIGEFAPNLSVTVGDSDVPDVATYVADAARSAGKMRYVDSALVAGPDGRDLGVVEYSIVQGGDREVRFLAYIDLVGDNLVIAGLGVSAASFEQVRALVEPYMQTLKAL
jgi:hypothetical protein